MLALRSYLWFVKLKRTQYVFTDQRILIGSGIVSRSSLAVPLPMVRGVAIHQGLVGRIADTGNVVVYTAVHQDPGTLVFWHVQQPRRVQQVLRDLVQHAIGGPPAVR